MDKGYYSDFFIVDKKSRNIVAIHNKNGQGLLQKILLQNLFFLQTSQSTIKMDKGYYEDTVAVASKTKVVAIHNKNGQGLLR